MIYRCNQCGFVAEEIHAAAGSKIPCARCQTPSTVYPTVFYVEKVVERYTAALRELKALKELKAPKEKIPSTSSAVSAPPKNLLSLASINIHNTSALATDKQHEPLKKWFQQHSITPQFDYARVDTSGFFDDAACAIGDNYKLFLEIVDDICACYRKKENMLNLVVGERSQKEWQQVHNFCRTLYTHTFFAYFRYQKKGKIIHLTLQNAPIIQHFFNGEWLEWYVFMAVLRKIQKNPAQFSCTRGMRVVFPNEDLHEFDVVCLPVGKKPLVIECKTGEFRHDIEKCTKIRKRLGIDKSNFIICAPRLSDEQACSLSAMYELSFVNLTMLEGKLAEVL